MLSAPIHATLSILCLILFLSVAVALFRHKELAYVRVYLLLALGVSITMDSMALLILPEAKNQRWIGLYLALHCIDALCWLMIGKSYARSGRKTKDVAPGWGLILLVAVATGVTAAFPDMLALSAPFDPLLAYRLLPAGFIEQLVVLCIIILAMMDLESTLVNSAHGQRWKIKFTILGMFAILASDVFVVSLGLLYRTIDLTLTPARQTGSIIGLVLLLYSTLYRGSEKPVVVSKRLASTSLVLFGTGIYLLFIGALGVAINLTDRSTSRAMLLAVGIVTGIGLLVLLLSERFRRRFTRILQLYFYKEKYDYRIQWLANTKRLSSARTREDLYQNVLLGMCETFGMGGGILYLPESGGIDLIPVQAWEVREHLPRLPLQEYILSAVRNGQPVIDLNRGLGVFDDAARDFYAKIAARFLVPLMRESNLDGLILLASPIDVKEIYTAEDYDLMEALASQANSVILNYRLADLLSQARDMEVFGKISAFIVHDLKNLVYPLSLLVDNAKHYIANPEFQQDLLKSLGNTVTKMHALITQLRQLPRRDMLRLENIELGQLVRDTFRHVPIDHLVITGPAVQVRIDPGQIQKVIFNLVRNAREASPAGQPITIEIGLDQQPFFRVSDSGCGMTERFIAEDLFQAFRTTKTNGIGIGLYQCRHIVEAHGGTIEVASTPGRGSVFTVRLPNQEAFLDAEVQ